MSDSTTPVSTCWSYFSKIKIKIIEKMKWYGLNCENGLTSLKNVYICNQYI